MIKVIIVMMIIFTMGIIIGNNLTINDNNYLENSKNEFEETITLPNNNYVANEYTYQNNIINKIAYFIDNYVFNKLGNKLDSDD
jgi:hypothetical protein